MILVTATTYAKFQSYVTTLGGNANQRRVFWANTPPGTFRTIAVIPSVSGGGAEDVGVLLTTPDPGPIPGTFLADFPNAIEVDAFGVL